MTYQNPRLVPLPHPEVTRESLGRALFELGWAEDREEAERLALALFPDLPGEIHLENQP
jgi:hypothetical protein